MIRRLFLKALAPLALFAGGIARKVVAEPKGATLAPHDLTPDDFRVMIRSDGMDVKFSVDSHGHRWDRILSLCSLRAGVAGVCKFAVPEINLDRLMRRSARGSFDVLDGRNHFLADTDGTNLKVVIGWDGEMFRRSVAIDDLAGAGEVVVFDSRTPGLPSRVRCPVA